jgi:hypothetical protein
MRKSVTHRAVASDAANTRLENDGLYWLRFGDTGDDDLTW